MGTKSGMDRTLVGGSLALQISAGLNSPRALGGGGKSRAQ
jgi:hypothetical protein